VQRYVVSGRDRVVLEKWMGDLDVGLCCEHGSFFRDARTRAWNSLADAGSIIEWGDPVMTLMRYY
jgi:trehalose-6-phosphatase